jgi:predicted PurR-regulated permease PerM
MTTEVLHSKPTETRQTPIRVHNWKSLGRFFIFLAVLVTVVFAAGYFYDRVMIAVYLAAFLAYLMNPLVNMLEGRRIHRSIATLIILTLFFGLMMWAAIRVFPYLYEQLVDLIQQVPALVDNLAKNAVKILRDFLRGYGVKENSTIDRALGKINLIEQGLARIQQAGQGVFGVGAGVFNSLLNMVLAPILAYYFVAEKPSITLALRRVTPRDIRPYCVRAIKIVDDALTNVIRGHLKVATALACLYAIGFSAIGLAAGAAIGFAAGVCRVIPYLDVVVGLTLGLTYIFTQGLPNVTVLWLVGVICIVQLLDGIFITPKLIGAKVGLHPMVVILTVIAASSQFGFWGVLLAIPGAAIIKSFYSVGLLIYRDSTWFNSGWRL